MFSAPIHLASFHHGHPASCSEDTWSVFMYPSVPSSFYFSLVLSVTTKMIFKNSGFHIVYKTLKAKLFRFLEMGDFLTVVGFGLQDSDRCWKGVMSWKIINVAIDGGFWFYRETGISTIQQKQAPWRHSIYLPPPRFVAIWPQLCGCMTSEWRSGAFLAEGWYVAAERKQRPM